MFEHVIARLKTPRDARLYERTFLGARRNGETASQTATRLYFLGHDETARAYELLAERWPQVFETGAIENGN